MKLLHSILVIATATWINVSVSAEQYSSKQLFHVTAPKRVFDATLPKFKGGLDVWRIDKVDGSDKVKADIYATDAEIALFQNSHNGKYEIFANETLIERDPVNTAQLLQKQAVTRVTCATKSRRFLQQTTMTKYVDNAFFDCWRTADEVLAFLDVLVTENPTLISKTASVATSIEGREIPAYKISTGGSGKKAIYIQGLIHAREWHAGSTTFYTIASLLDGLRNGDASITSIVNKYDWVFVPIVNIDGFRYTFNGNRLWRKNRRKISGNTYGVDLNRNFGPLSSFGKAGDGPTSETYPGTAPLSEPETAGIWKFVKSLPLAGAIDIHSYSALVLRPLGIQYTEAAAPYGAKLKTLGDNVKTATQVGNSVRYTSQTAAALYLCYGTFLDAVFLELNKTASLSFEMEGNNFVVDKSVIRPGGLHVFQGVVQFAKELTTYYT